MPTKVKISDLNMTGAKQHRRRLVADARAALDGAEKENRTMSDAERAKYDDALDEVGKVDTHLAKLTLERSETFAAARAQDGGPRGLTAHLREQRSGLGAIAKGQLEGEGAYRPPADKQYRGATYFRDMVAVHFNEDGAAEARERLNANNNEWADRIEQRTGIASDSSGHGAEFAPPVWASPSYDYVPALRAGRPYLDWLGTNPLPLGLGPDLLLPVVTSGATVTEMANDGATVSNTDPVTATDTVAIGTISGRSIASQQILSLGPQGDAWIVNDLGSAFTTAGEFCAIQGTATNRKGIQHTASPSTLASTGLSLFDMLNQGAYQIAVGAPGLEADYILTHPALWLSLVASLNSHDSRPDVAMGEGEGYNTRATMTGQSVGHVGSLFGVPVIVSQNVNHDLVGDSSYQAGVYVASRQAFTVMESSPRIRIADQVSISTLQVQFVMYGFQAQIAQYPKGVCVVTGTGNIPATGFHP